MKYDIFPLCLPPDDSDPRCGIGLPAWRWMATVWWVTPDGRENFRVNRTLCPLRLMRWVYLVALRAYRESHP